MTFELCHFFSTKSLVQECVDYGCMDLKSLLQVVENPDR